MKVPKSGPCRWPAARHSKRRWINSIVITTRWSRIMGWSHVIRGWLHMMTDWLIKLHHRLLEYNDQKLIDLSNLQAGLWENCRSLLLQLFLVSRCRVLSIPDYGTIFGPSPGGKGGGFVDSFLRLILQICVFFKLTLFLRRTSSLLLEYTSHIGPTSFLRGWLEIWIIINNENDYSSSSNTILLRLVSSRTTATSRRRCLIMPGSTSGQWGSTRTWPMRRWASPTLAIPTSLSLTGRWWRNDGPTMRPSGCNFIIALVLAITIISDVMIISAMLTSNLAGFSPSWMTLACPTRPSWSSGATTVTSWASTPSGWRPPTSRSPTGFPSCSGCLEQPTRRGPRQTRLSRWSISSPPLWKRLGCHLLTFAQKKSQQVLFFVRRGRVWCPSWETMIKSNGEMLPFGSTGARAADMGGTQRWYQPLWDTQSGPKGTATPSGSTLTFSMKRSSVPYGIWCDHKISGFYFPGDGLPT